MKKKRKKKRRVDIIFSTLSTDAHNLWPIIVWRTYNSFLKSIGYLLCIIAFKCFCFLPFFKISFWHLIYLTCDIRKNGINFLHSYFVLLEPLKKDPQGYIILLKWNSSCFFWAALIKYYQHAWFLQASRWLGTKNILCKYIMCMHFISPFNTGKAFSAYIAGWFHDILTKYCMCFIQMYHNSNFIFIGHFSVLWIWQSSCCGFFSISITWKFWATEQALLECFLSRIAHSFFLVPALSSCWLL